MTIVPEALTNAVADLADAMTSLRELAEREVERQAEADREDAERNERRLPAEWEHALRDVEAWLNQQHVEGATGDPARGPSPTSVPLVGTDTARKIIEALDATLRQDRYVPLRSALDTLAGRKPPKDLRAEAEAWAASWFGTLEANARFREAAVTAYLAGAGVRG